MYNCPGSHDTARFLTEAKGEAWRLRLAMALQMLFPGAPAIYYGDELGMDRRKRPGLPWRHGLGPSGQRICWPGQKELIALRQAHPALRTGSYTPLLADDEKSLFAFARGNRGGGAARGVQPRGAGANLDRAGELVTFPAGFCPYSISTCSEGGKTMRAQQKPSWRSSPAWMLLCSCALAEDVTLQFWHHYSAQSAENATLMNVLIPAFEAENPGIKVNAVSHEWAELHDKVLVSAKSGALPDVARCDIAWLPEFQKMGILTALDEEMEDFDTVSAALLPSAMSTAVIDGHDYALALNTNSKIVFYNKAMLEAAGVAVPETMEQWCGSLRKLSGEECKRPADLGLERARAGPAGTCARSSGALAAA